MNHWHHNHLYGEYECAVKTCHKISKSPRLAFEHFGKMHLDANGFLLDGVQYVKDKRRPKPTYNYYNFNKHNKYFYIKLLDCTHPGCKKHCSNENQLNQHLRVDHLTKYFRCIVCAKFYPNIHQLQAHSNQSHSTALNNCIPCGDNYPSAAYLSIHNTFHHETGIFKCQYCGIAKTRRIDVINHFYLQHNY